MTATPRRPVDTTEKNEKRKPTTKEIVMKPGIYPSKRIDNASEYSDPESESDTEDLQEELLDIDMRNIDKPEKLAKYAETIFTLAQDEIESAIASSPDKFISTQQEITPSMYEIAVKWMFQIQEQYAMSSDTLFSAVAYLNTVLSRQSISRARIQLVTVTCIWMASKMEERSVPKIEDLCEMCSKDYTSDDFVECEKELIVLLDFRLNYPTSKLFVRRMLDVIDADGELVEVTSFFCDISLIPVEVWSFPPDVVALAAACLGKLCLGEFCPTKRLCLYGHIEDLESVRACARVLLRYARQVMDPSSRLHFMCVRYTRDPLTKAITRIDMSDELADRIAM